MTSLQKHSAGKPWRRACTDDFLYITTPSFAYAWRFELKHRSEIFRLGPYWRKLKNLLASVVCRICGLA